jgi:signal transduction histidine kinase
MNYNIHNLIKTILLVLCYIASGTVFGQNPNFTKIKKFIDNGQTIDAIKTLKTFEHKKLRKDQLARTYFYLGIAYGNDNKNDICFNYLNKSQNLYLALDSIPSAMEVKLELAYALSVENYDHETNKQLYQEYIDYAEGSKNPKLITKGYYEMASFLIEEEPELSQKYFFKALKVNKKTKDEKAYRDIIFHLAGLYCTEDLNQPDSAMYYYEKALVISKKQKNVYDICLNLFNQAHIYSTRKDYSKAISLLKEAQRLPIKQYVKNINSLIHQNLSKNYAALSDYSKAYTELIKYNETNDKDVFFKQNKQILDLQTKYDTKNKELKVLTLTTKNNNKTLLIYLFVGLLVIVSFLGYLRINFLNKKKKIAEQEKLIEAQKLANALKEHELKEIDKLLEGQEKERLKIANDLHDNLGSLMATLKLNFQNLKRNSQTTLEEEELLFEKTDAMLDEAYQKIRGIAHSKNAGVIANEGLLPAIMNMAKKATVPGRLSVQVIPFGLDERIDNTIEVNIFRMVQEILTNAIKHSEANEITIHLTQHHDSLNIIIEDNGKGFIPKNRDKKEGMGLPNIEKKVEHMGGTFTIDSTQGKGTSILIDLPL